MGVRSNKITIRVSPSRHEQVMRVSATGLFGRVSLTVPPQQVNGQPLSPASDQKAYWADVLAKAQQVIADL